MINFNYIQSLKEKSDTSDEKIKQILDGVALMIRDLDALATEVLKASKTAINNTLHGREVTAQKDLKEAKKKLLFLQKKVEMYKQSLGKDVAASQIKINNLQNSKFDSADTLLAAAKEECLEAHLLYTYLSSGRKVDIPKEPVFQDLESYIGALCDMCGELLRKARLEVIEKTGSQENIEHYYRDTKNIYDTLSTFAFSNKSGLRGKIEQLKGYIAVFEGILYDISEKTVT